MLHLCPRCKGPGVRVIFSGFPLWFCATSMKDETDNACNCLWGFWSWVLYLIPYNGTLFYYDYKRYAYPTALYKWMTMELPSE